MSDDATDSGALTIDTAASAFGKILDAEPPKEEPAKAEPAATPAEPATSEEAPAEPSEDDPLVTIKVDGKDVEVKLSELKNGYQRQADYTRKTMETAAERKAAQAEAQKAQQERQQYAANLQMMQAQLQGALQEQSKIDWADLIKSDPVQYLQQRHLAEVRQAQLAQVQQEQQKMVAQYQAEARDAYARHLAQQQEELAAKLPEWKDGAKAQAEKAALREYLKSEGFDDSAIENVSDAKAVLLARKAMLYDQMVSKANAAAKKVSTLPTKVERPGGGESPQLDRRTASYQRLSKSGKVEDAAAVFASIL